MRNDFGLLPLDGNEKYAQIVLGDHSGLDFTERVKQHASVKTINSKSPEWRASDILNKLNEFEKIEKMPNTCTYVFVQNQKGPNKLAGTSIPDHNRLRHPPSTQNHPHPPNIPHPNSPVNTGCDTQLQRA